MSRSVEVDFIEYGKRFLLPGTTDYAVLDLSNEYMVNGVSQQSNFRFLREDGIDIRENSNFRELIGSVTTALVQLNRRIGDLQNPYLFAQIQSRREDELDEGNGTMHRNFSQIRFTLLDRKTILSGGALYPSLLSSISLSSSNNSFRNITALADYIGKVNPAPSGKKTVRLLESMEISARYFKAYEDVYLSDLKKHISLILSSFDKNPSSFVAANFSISISNLVRLSPPELLLYKLMLVQDIQTVVGWRTGHILTFKMSDIINRAVQLKVNGVFSDSAGDEISSNKIFPLSVERDFRSSFPLLYSPLMQSIVNSPVFSGKNEKEKNINKFFELYDLIENGVGDIESNFLLLLGAHPDEKVLFHLYSALNKRFSDQQQRNNFILELVLKETVYVLPLLSYHESQGNWDEILKIYITLHSSLKSKSVISNKEKNPNTHNIFDMAFNRLGWEGAFLVFDSYYLDNQISDFEIFSNYKRVINNSSLCAYLAEKIFQNKVLNIERLVFSELIKKEDFQDYFANHLKELPWKKILTVLVTLKEFSNKNAPFYLKCIIALAQQLSDNESFSDADTFDKWISVIEHYKLCSGGFLFQNINIGVSKTLLRFSVLFNSVGNMPKLIEYAGFWFNEILKLLDYKDNRDGLFESSYLTMASSLRQVKLSSNEVIQPVNYFISLGRFPDDMFLSDLDDRFKPYVDQIREIWLRNATMVQWNVYEIQDLLKTVYSDNKFDEKLLAALKVCEKTWDAKQIQKFPPELAALWLYYAKKSNWAGRITLAEIFSKHLNQPLKALCSFNLNKFTLEDFLLLLREDIRLDKQITEVERQIKESELLLSLHKKLT